MILYLLFLLVVPFLMLFTARAVHQDETLRARSRGLLAASVVLFPPVIVAYWLRRLGRRNSARSIS